MTTTNFSQLGAPRGIVLNIYSDRNGQQRGNLIFAHVSTVCKSKLGIMSHILLEDIFEKHEIYGLKPTNFIKKQNCAR